MADLQSSLESIRTVYDNPELLNERGKNFACDASSNIRVSNHPDWGKKIKYPYLPHN